MVAAESSRCARPLLRQVGCLVQRIIGQTPQIGRVYRRSPVSGTRRVLLKGSRYHVYYIPGVDEVRVLAVWHAQRGVGPPLREP